MLSLLIVFSLASPAYATTATKITTASTAPTVTSTNLTNTPTPPATTSTNPATTPLNPPADANEIATNDMLLEIISACLDTPCDKDSLIRLNIVPEYSFIWRTDDTELHFCDAYKVLLPLYGIYPYPAFYYPDILPRENHLDSTEDLDASIAAVLIGLTKPTAWRDINAMRKIDLFNLVAKLEAGEFTPLEAPTELPENIANTKWDYRTFGLRNAILIARDQLPTAWYEDFLAQDWQFAYEIPSEIAAQFNVPDTLPGAATVCAHKTIYLRTGCCTPSCVAHELVHYLIYRANISADTLTEYYEEAKAANFKMRKYGWTSPEEYFAVFMERWITIPKDRKTLTEKVPKTAALAAQLTENFPALLKE